MLPAFVCKPFVLFISCQFVYKSWPCSYLVGFVFKTLALFVSCESCPYPRLLTSFCWFDLLLCRKYWAYNTNHYGQRSQSFVGARRNLSRMRSKSTRARVLVKQSACCFLVDMCLTRKKPSTCRFCIWWYLIAMCRVRRLAPGCLIRSVTALLSSWNWTGRFIWADPPR